MTASPPVGAGLDELPPDPTRSWRREHYLPIRKSELIRWLARRPGLLPDQRWRFLEVCRITEAILHLEFQHRLELLKDCYAPFNPDLDTLVLTSPDADGRADLVSRVFEQFLYLLERANYERLSREQIQEVVGAASDWGIRLHVDFEIFQRLEVFVRGDVIGQRTRRRLWNLYRPEQVDVPIYQRLVVLFQLRSATSGPVVLDARPESVFVKLFKNVPKVDVDMLLPGTRIRLSNFDRGKIVLPTLSGLVLAAIKIIKGAVFAALFGGVMGLVTFLGFVIGTIGYGVRSFFGYLNTKDKYQLNLTRSLYYQNLDNNAGVLYRLLDEAEEQECREAVLAYYVLWRAEGERGLTCEELDQEAERMLRDELSLDVDFEADDAVDKLLRLGIARADSEGRLRVLPADRALERLDRTWDDYFSSRAMPPDAPGGE